MCSDEIPTKVKQSIESLIQKEGYLTYDMHTQRITTNGGNLLGELYEVDVKGKTNNGDKETSVFVKVKHLDESIEWASISNIFRTELFTYRELSDVFAELQEVANIPLQERYKIVRSYEDSSTEAIILENIARKGFIVYDRMKLIPLEFAEVAIKELAKLHGLSFALQEKQPDYFNSKIKGIKYAMVFCDDFDAYCRNMIDLTMQYIDDDVKGRVETAYNKLADKYAQYFEDEASRRCICHGDYKSRNMMFKMNNGKVADFIVIDYQFLHYGCPILDILSVIFVNTDQQFRKAHLSHLKDLYHETLTTFLGYFNIDVDLVYSRETFEQDFKEKLDYGLLLGFVALSITLVNEDCVPDVNGELSGITFQVHDTYRERQREMIEEFTEWGYI